MRLPNSSGQKALQIYLAEDGKKRKQTTSIYARKQTPDARALSYIQEQLFYPRFDGKTALCITASYRVKSLHRHQTQCLAATYTH